MKVPKAKLQELAAEWRAARRVYPLYAAAIKTFNLDIAPCASLESPIDRGDESSVKEVREWLEFMDQRCTAAQIRQIIQHSNLGTAACLRALIQRYLAKAEKTAEDRFKLDFLLAQYFAESASRTVIVGKVQLQDVAQVLEPVLGECPLSTPRFLEPLNGLIDRIHASRTLRDLMSQGVVESGRKLKDQAGEMYFGPSVLVAFVRYNFLLRRAFVGMLHADVEAIGRGLRELERANVSYVDCSSAGFSGTEPISDLRQYCRSWRKIFVADYANGPSFESIAGIRQAVEAAVQASRHAEKLKSERVTLPVPAQVVVTTQKVTPVSARTISSEVAQIETARAHVETVLNPKPAEKDSKAGESLQHALAHIARQVASAKQKIGTAMTVELSGTQVVLSPWELSAFTASDTISGALQRAVVARTMIMHASEQLQKGASAAELATALDAGHKVAAEMREQIAQARAAQNLDGAVNMAASSKRLMTVMGEAERCLTVSK